MADRVTQADLERIVARINGMTGKQFELSGAYGGWSLRTQGGGYDILGSGHVSKRDLRDLMFAFIAGIMTAKEVLNAD